QRRTDKHCLTHTLFSLPAAAFKVRTPQPVVLAIYGQPAILKCLFPASSDRVDPSLVVTWQRVEDSQVVHSFYYGTDQLDRQSVRYHNRTKLFHSQLADGNASLRLDRVGPEDQGRYLCSATNTNGSGKIVVQLKYAAFYTEPRLTVCGRTSNVTFLYETEGYPEPEVHWLDPQGFKLDYNLSVTQSARAPGLLLSLRAQLVVQAGLPINYTFSLKNQVLEQVIERPLSYGEQTSTMDGWCDGNSNRSTLLNKEVQRRNSLGTIKQFINYYLQIREMCQPLTNIIVRGVSNSI
uniref:Ig-like domain-containing protein n=1 Tax=Esox lucius TaxID=8010 RepID=A0AAY5KCQ0_ESOLU